MAVEPPGKPGVFDVAVIGGGIVGAATAMALLDATPELSLVLLEKEARLAAHQTGHNSGVIHSGLYYRPGSLKAQNCTAGREALYAFCAEHAVPYERCGKVVVATREEELPQLAELERRGRENGLEGIERLDAGQLRDCEPHVKGIAGLHVPQTGIVDYVAVTEAYAEVVRRRGGEIRTASRVVSIRRTAEGFRLGTSRGEVQCRTLINCAGLQCDRVARLAGVDPQIRIVPFRGEYYELVEARRHLVSNLIYPVPDPAFPFLGVHFTRMIDGTVEAGPNAVLAFKREGYGRLSFSLADTLGTAAYGGFWWLAGRYWLVGLREYYRSFSKGAFVRDLQRLIPVLREEDVVRGGAGVRAQAVDAGGKLLDDFHIVEAEGMIHVLNAPSPAATASIAIGRSVAEKARQSFGLG
jgi:L-2-hydroxyglutarate oxidase